MIITDADLKNFRGSKQMIKENYKYYRDKLKEHDTFLRQTRAVVSPREGENRAILYKVSVDYDVIQDNYKRFKRLHDLHIKKKKPPTYRYTLEEYRAIPLERIIGDFTELKRVPSGYKGLSPFSSEKTASFYINTEKNLYYCFSTSQGGDSIKFFQQLQGASFKESLNLLRKYI